MEPAKVVSIHQRAVENLKYIGETMERAGSFTAVPGWGGVLMGISALLTSLISSQLPSKDVWFLTWLGEAFLALAIGGWAMVEKAKAAQAPILAFFAIRWLPRCPRQALSILTLQAGAALAALAPVYFLHL